MASRDRMSQTLGFFLGRCWKHLGAWLLTEDCFSLLTVLCWLTFTFLTIANITAFTKRLFAAVVLGDSPYPIVTCFKWPRSFSSVFFGANTLPASQKAYLVPLDLPCNFPNDPEEKHRTMYFLIDMLHLNSSLTLKKVQLKPVHFKLRNGKIIYFSMLYSLMLIMFRKISLTIVNQLYISSYR